MNKKSYRSGTGFDIVNSSYMTNVLDTTKSASAQKKLRESAGIAGHTVAMHNIQINPSQFELLNLG